MYSRLLRKPDTSTLLLGPRGTGKSTWIAQHFHEATRYDLLDTREALRLEREPSRLFNELRTVPAGGWVVLDEVQKVPALLDEVQRLIESCGLRFILCGSSARKLKRSGVNLLAGRAIEARMFPLVSAEIGPNFDLQAALATGTLPLAVTGTDPIGFLTTYAHTYLNEEIRAEAVTRNVASFSRFLEIAARQNAQVTNLSNISREAGVARSTVQNYFEIISDTLLGYWVEPWKLKRATKQVAHPKFYLFDTGVTRALSGRLPYPPSQEETGPLLETYLFHEIRSFLGYSKLRYHLHFWRSHDGAEVDLLCETREGYVAIEMKAAMQWQKRFSGGLHRLRGELTPTPVKTYGVYLGERRALLDDVLVLPSAEFLRMLWNGDIIRP
ncbi:MAG: AAA family ATPase [bacterium]